MKLMRFITASAIVSLMALPVSADESAFHAGPVFKDFGKIADVQTPNPLPKRLKMRVAFDVGKATEPGDINRSLNSIGRFINMHVDAGLALDNIDVALVVHGGAAHDLTIASHYAGKYDGAENVNASVIKELTGAGVEIYLCGQTAAYHDIENNELLPGVEMSLSAMTAHALLQQQGYTLNPF